MICILDVIAWPFYLIGGSVLFIVAGGILAIISGVALMIVMWKRRRNEKKDKEDEKCQY